MFRDTYSWDYQLLSKQAYEGRLICDPRPRARRLEWVQCLLCCSVVMMAQQLSWTFLPSKTPGPNAALWNTDMLHCIQLHPPGTVTSRGLLPVHLPPSVHTQESILQVAVTSNCVFPGNVKFPVGTEVGWQGKSYRTASCDAAPGHTCELPEWAWLSPLPCLALIHSESFSLVSIWRHQHRSPAASEKADRKCLHFTEEKTKA